MHGRRQDEFQVVTQRPQEAHTKIRGEQRGCALEFFYYFYKAGIHVKKILYIKDIFQVHDRQYQHYRHVSCVKDRNDEHILAIF